MGQSQLKNQSNGSHSRTPQSSPLEKARRFALARQLTKTVDQDLPQAVSRFALTELQLVFESIKNKDQAVPDYEYRVKHKADYIVITFIILISIKHFLSIIL